MTGRRRAVVTVEVDRERFDVRFERLAEAILEDGGTLGPQDTVENLWRVWAKEMAQAVAAVGGLRETNAIVRLEVDGEEVPLR
jgi:hypothetical protein